MEKKFVFLTCLMLASTGCAASSGGRTTTVVVREAVNELDRDPVPGTVNDVWIAPMYEDVFVPGQLDPHRVYYRKPHHTVIEVIPERVQLPQYPEDRPAEESAR